MLAVVACRSGFVSFRSKGEGSREGDDRDDHYDDDYRRRSVRPTREGIIRRRRSPDRDDDGDDNGDDGAFLSSASDGRDASGGDGDPADIVTPVDGQIRRDGYVDDIYRGVYDDGDDDDRIGRAGGGG